MHRRTVFLNVKTIHLLETALIPACCFLLQAAFSACSPWTYEPFAGGRVTIADNSPVQSPAPLLYEDVVLTAVVKDYPAKPAYQWQRGPEKDGPFTDISGEESSTYTIGGEDVLSYIRVTVSAEGFSGSISAVTQEKVSAVNVLSIELKDREKLTVEYGFGQSLDSITLIVHYDDPRIPPAEITKGFTVTDPGSDRVMLPVSPADGEKDFEPFVISYRDKVVHYPVQQTKEESINWALDPSEVPGKITVRSLERRLANAVNRPHPVDRVNLKLYADETLPAQTIEMRNTKEIVLEGIGAERTIDLGGTGALFSIQSGILTLEGNVTLRGKSGNSSALVLIQGGAADDAVFNMDNNSKIIANQNIVSAGGAIYAKGGTVNIRSSVVGGEGGAACSSAIEPKTGGVYFETETSGTGLLNISGQGARVYGKSDMLAVFIKPGAAGKITYTLNGAARDYNDPEEYGAGATIVGN